MFTLEALLASPSKSSKENSTCRQSSSSSTSTSSAASSTKCLPPIQVPRATYPFSSSTNFWWTTLHPPAPLLPNFWLHVPLMTSSYLPQSTNNLHLNFGQSTQHPENDRTKSRCHICGKRFSRHWLLQGHMRTHTGEKPFSCAQCHKSFADKSNLRAHIQTHSGAKPYACQKCGKRFALKSYLSKHKDSSCNNNDLINRLNSTVNNNDNRSSTVS